MENNIDDIFTKAIEPLETQPSEEFWRKAAEDVIVRGSKATERKMVRWRAAAFVLGAGLFLLSYFTYRLQNGLDNVDKKIEAVKNLQNQNIPRSNENNAPIQNNNPAVNTVHNNAVVVNGKQYVNKIASANASKTSPLTGKSTFYKTINTPKIIASYKQANKTALHKATRAKGYKKNAPIVYNTSQPGTNAATLSHISRANDNSINNFAGNNIDNSNPNLPVAEKMPKTDTTDNLAVLSDDTIDNVTGQTAAASISDTARIMLPKSFTPGDSISRLSVSVIFAPDYLVNYKFKATDAWGSQSENTIKNGEKQNFSYSTGAIADYKLSPRVSISAGITYQVYSFSTQAGTIYDRKQSDGDVGYYMATSSGIITCPYSGYSKIGDSLQVNTSSSRKYLDIPMQAKYFFITSTKFRMYATLGVEVNFSLGDNTVMNWQNFWNESGTEDISNAEGSRNMYFCYYIGMGISYKVANSLSFYIEPGLHEAVTPIDDNIDIVTYPRLFSFLTGISYTLN